jgi:hypothetical protein
MPKLAEVINSNLWLSCLWVLERCLVGDARSDTIADCPYNDAVPEAGARAASDGRGRQAYRTGEFRLQPHRRHASLSSDFHGWRTVPAQWFCRRRNGAPASGTANWRLDSENVESNRWSGSSGCCVDGVSWQVAKRFDAVDVDRANQGRSPKTSSKNLFKNFVEKRPSRCSRTATARKAASGLFAVRCEKR